MRRREFIRGLTAAAATPLFASRAAGQEGPPRPTRMVQGPMAAPAASPVLMAATEQFQNMRETRYQHKNMERPEEGIFFYDCVGFATYTLRLGTPLAHQAMMEGLRIRPGFVPSPALYIQWISYAGEEPNPVWQRVPRVADIMPGDVLAWAFEGNNPVLHGGATGHSVIAAGPPLPLSNGSFALLVYDSTASFHGPFDTRHTDPRNLPLGGDGPHAANPSGLGRGTMQFHPDPATGAPVSVSWTVGTLPTTAPIIIGRALR